MKPVTEHDVTRYARGEITDPAEAARISRAIDTHPELEVLFHVQTDGAFDDLEDGLLDSGIDAVTPTLAKVRALQSLQATARLYRLNGCLPAAGANDEIAMPLMSGRESVPTTCRFIPSPEKPGVYRVCVPLPPNRRVLSLAIGDLRWGDSNDETEVPVRPSWSDRPAPSTTRLAADGGERSVANLAALAAASAGSPVTSVDSTRREHRGSTVDVKIGSKPWSAEIFRRDTKPFWPIPLMFTALAAGGEAIASEVRLLRNGQNLMENLFEDCTERVYWLNVAPLSTKNAFRLKPVDAAELLGSCNSAVRVLSPIPGCPGEYSVDLSDTVVQERLASPHVVLAMEVAELEGEVQP